MDSENKMDISHIEDAHPASENVKRLAQFHIVDDSENKTDKKTLSLDSGADISHIVDDIIDYTDPDEIEEYHKVKYTWFDLLEMMCGTSYYSRSELLYTYLMVNGLQDEAEHVLLQIAKEFKQNRRKCMKRMQENDSIKLPAIDE